MANQVFKVVNNQSMGASFNSQEVNILNYADFSVTATFSDSPVGTLKLQASNDLSTWEDIPDTSYSVTTAGSVLYNCVEQEYSYYRISYTRSSGTGTFNAFTTLKG